MGAASSAWRLERAGEVTTPRAYCSSAVGRYSVTHSIVLPQDAGRGGLGINVRCHSGVARVVRVKKGTPASVMLCATRGRRRGDGGSEGDGASGGAALFCGSDSGSDAGDDCDRELTTGWGARSVTLRRITVGDILIGANGLSLLDAYSAKELSQRIAAAAQSGGGKGAQSGSIRLDFCAAAHAAEARDGTAASPTAGAHSVGERCAVLFRIVAASAAARADSEVGANAPAGECAGGPWLDAVGRAVAALAVRDTTVRAWRRAFAGELATPSASREGALCAHFIAPGGRFDALEQSAVAELGRYRRRAERFAAERAQPTWRAAPLDLAPARESRRLWMAWRTAKDPVAQMQRVMDDVATRLAGQPDDDEIVSRNAAERDALRRLYGERRRALRWAIGSSAGLHLRPASACGARGEAAPAAKLSAAAEARDALLTLAQGWALATLDSVWRQRPRNSAEQCASERALHEARLVVESAIYVPLEKRVLRLLAEREEIDAYYAAALAEPGDAPGEVRAAAAAEAEAAAAARGAQRSSSGAMDLASEQTPSLGAAPLQTPPRRRKRRSEYVGWSPMREVMVRRSNERLLSRTQTYFGIPESHCGTCEKRSLCTAVP